MVLSSFAVSCAFLPWEAISEFPSSSSISPNVGCAYTAPGLVCVIARILARSSLAAKGFTR